MIELLPSQLTLASNWEAMEPNFGREGSKPFQEGLHPIAQGLKRRHWLGVSVEAEGGLECFAHIFLYDATAFPKVEEDDSCKMTRHEGISIYLCLLGPYAAIGHSSKYMSYDKKPGKTIGHGGLPSLSLDRLLDRSSPDDTVEQAAFNEVGRTIYRVLTRQELQTPLPDGIKPMDPCGLGPPPYTYFDLLFNSTD